MKILITGAAGFIGFHLSRFLKNNNFEIFGIDNLNSYYDLDLKKYRLKLLKDDNIKFATVELNNFSKLRDIFLKEKPDCVINLAAQVVRFSLRTIPRKVI